MSTLLLMNSIWIKILDHLVYVDDQEAIQNVLKLFPFYGQFVTKDFSPLCFPLGYYQHQVNSDWARVLIFHREKNILIDYLNKQGKDLPKWIFNDRKASSMVPELCGTLGVGKYLISHSQKSLTCELRYGKGLTLTHRFELISRRKLVAIDRGMEFNFVEINQ